MNEKITQLEEKINELEIMEHSIRAELLKIGDEAKKVKKYEYGQLIPYSNEEKFVDMPEYNISIMREKSYKSFSELPDSYKDFHSFAEYIEGYSAPHGYPNKEYDMGINTRFSGIFFEILFTIPLCLIGGIFTAFPVMWLCDIPFLKAYALSALGFGILSIISMMKEKIRQNNAKEPLDDPDYVAEKIKYEAIVDERNKKLERDQQLIEEYSKKLDEISKSKAMVIETLKLLKKDGN